MHSVDPTTEMMIRSVLAYAKNRLRLDPVPLDGCHPDAEAMAAVLDGLIGEEPHNPDQVLGAYTSVLAPAVISADSPRFLGFIPAAPTKASLLFDMLVPAPRQQGQCQRQCECRRRWMSSRPVLGNVLLGTIRL